MEQKRVTYQYKCENALKTRLTPYSKAYDNLKDLSTWYFKNGRKLEKMFNRNLILTENIYDEESND